VPIRKRKAAAARRRGPGTGPRQKESSFSEEKEAKRLLQTRRGDRFGLGADKPMSKSFLLLFFKKEVLPLNLP
jgi:hypothetical protein